MGDPHVYRYVLHETDPTMESPRRIKLPLKMHQLAALKKALTMEQKGFMYSQVEVEIERANAVGAGGAGGSQTAVVKIETNVAIIGDMVGYGKTLIALGIIAENPVANLWVSQTRTFSSMRTDTSIYRYTGYFQMTYETLPTNLRPGTAYIPTTLVLVPRGPVYNQWKQMIHGHTTLNALCIDNQLTIKNQLPPQESPIETLQAFFGQYDLVLVKTTTMKKLCEYYECLLTHRRRSAIRWARIVVDEGHDELDQAPFFLYDFLWIITSSYARIPGVAAKSTHHHTLASQLSTILTDITLPYLTLRGAKPFVLGSFDIPPPVEYYYLCKTPLYMNVILPFMNARVMDMVNANDVCGLVRVLGGENHTETDLVGLITREMQRAIHNKEIERASVATMDLSEDEKQTRYGSIDAELEKLNEKKRLLEERISQIDQKQCAICLNTLEDPIMLTCTHLFCGRCLVEWIVSQRDKLRPPCPTCREPILFQRLVAVIKGAGDDDDERRRSHQEASTSAAGSAEELTQQIGRYSKEEVLLKLLRQKPDGRFLIFAKNDGSMLKIMTLLTEHRILWAELKGNTPTMLSVMEKFRTNWYKVILLRPQHAGSGIDLSMATDVILFHKLFEDRTQAIGRAQRVGRQTPLTIHNLCYIQEMNDHAA